MVPMVDLQLLKSSLTLSYRGRVYGMLAISSSSSSFFLRFYLFINERQREAETQVEGEAGFMQGA